MPPPAPSRPQDGAPAALWPTLGLAALSGTNALFAWAAWRDLADLAGVGGLLLVVLLAGPALGLVALVLGGVLLRTGGQLLGGRASAGQVRAALARAVAPPAAGLALWGLQAALLPAASFSAAPAAPPQGLVAALCALVHGGLWLWAAWRSLAGLAAAHSISPARAAASWLLAALMVAAACLVALGGSALAISLLGQR